MSDKLGFHPKRPALLGRIHASDGVDIVSCDPQAYLPGPELALDKVNTSGDGKLVSCDPQPYLPTDSGELSTYIAPWAAKNGLQLLQAQSKRPPAPDISRGLGQSQAKKDIVALAKHIKDKFKLLVHKAGGAKGASLYVFDPPCWQRLSEEDAQRMILSQLKASELDDCITDSDTKAIYKRLRLEPDLFYPGNFDPPNGAINFLDGTYNVLTGEFYDHCPEDHFTTYVNVSWAEVRNAHYGSTFEFFVDNLSNGDSAVRSQLLELTIILLARIQLKYFYVLIGESGTGKTQFGRFLTELIGRENVETVRNIDDFSDKWTVGSLAGKQLVTCLDLPNGPLPPAAVGIIKQFVGDDPVKGEKKNHDPFTYYRKPLLLVAGNYPIRLRKLVEEQAFLNRMVCIPFCNPVPPQEQQQRLYEKLLAEAPYIIREGINAFHELAQRNFQVTRSELPDEFQPTEGNLLARDVQRYVQESLMYKPESECTTEDLWNDYCEVSMERDLCQLNKIAFSRTLTQVLEAIDAPVQPVKRACGTESRGYRGIAIPKR